jgi:hypothetical protein
MKSLSPGKYKFRFYYENDDYDMPYLYYKSSSVRGTKSIKKATTVTVREGSVIRGISITL